jgi:intracellular septation protein A
MGAATNLLRHAGPHLLEATLGPTACFLTGRALWGVNGALALAVAWTGACMARRALRGQQMSGLLLIGMTTLVLRATVCLALQSERAYLIAPALVTVVMGVVYVASALTAKPLLGRVMGDLVPASWVDAGDPRAARLCRIASLVWGGEQIISAVVSLALIVHLSTTSYVVYHDPVSWGILAVVLGATVPFFWSDLRSLRRRVWTGAEGEPAGEAPGQARTGVAFFPLFLVFDGASQLGHGDRVREDRPEGVGVGQQP